MPTNTAASQLRLAHPSAEAEPTGQTLLVWGGSTSVGSNAIQLAVAAGYEVVATTSPRNFDYVRSLGATRVFDYNSPDVVPEIIAALKAARSPARSPSAPPPPPPASRSPADAGAPGSCPWPARPSPSPGSAKRTGDS